MPPGRPGAAESSSASSVNDRQDDSGRHIFVDSSGWRHSDVQYLRNRLEQLHMQQTLEGLDTLLQRDQNRTLPATLEALHIARDTAEYLNGPSRGDDDDSEVAELDKEVAKIFREAASLVAVVAELQKSFPA